MSKQDEWTQAKMPQDKKPDGTVSGRLPPLDGQAAVSRFESMLAPSTLKMLRQMGFTVTKPS